MIEKYTEWGYAGTKSASWISQGMEWVVSGISLVVDTVAVLETAWHEMFAVAGKVAELLVGSFESVVQAAQAVVGVVASVAGGLNESLGATFTGMKDQLGEVVDAAKEYREAIAKNTLASVESANAAFNKIGQGARQTRQLVDEIQGAATERAKNKQRKARLHRALRTPRKARGHQIRSGSRAWVGGRYSAILTSKGMQSNAQQQIALNTKTTADATTMAVAVLKEISKTLGAQGAGGGIGGGLGKL